MGVGGLVDGLVEVGGDAVGRVVVDVDENVGVDVGVKGTGRNGWVLEGCFWC